MIRRECVFFFVVFSVIFAQTSLGTKIDSKYFMLGQPRHTRSEVYTKPLWEPTWTDKLKQDLITNYDKYSRPTEFNNITRVTISIVLVHVSLDYSKSEMILNCWVSMRWMDDKLKWNSTDYNGLSSINIPHHEIWLPDILAYNSAHGNVIDYYGQTSTIVKSDGTVLWIPPSQFTVFCNMDLTFWPYDRQTCQLRLGSWTYTGHSIDVQVEAPQNPDPSSIWASTEDLEASDWKVINVSQKRLVQYYSCCPEPYVEVVFKYTIERDSVAPFHSIILPAIVTMILTLLVFWLPPDAVENFILNALCAVISSLFLIYFSQKLPIMVEHTPIIVLFYTNVLCLMCGSFVIFVTLNNLTRQKSHVVQVPKFLRPFGESKILMEFLLIPPVRKSDSSTVQMNLLNELNKHSAVNRSQVSLGNLQPSSSKDTDEALSTDHWRSVAIGVQRISFICYIIVYLTLIIKWFY